MLDVILAYDDKDVGTEELPGLDFFFEACALDFIVNIDDTSDFNITEIEGDKLNLDEINKTLSNNHNPCLFIAFSHGDTDALLCENLQDFYLKVDVNDDKLKGCIFYTWSCLTGKELGNSLVSKGCLAYIGYEDSVIAGTGEIEKFIKSANFGLSCLIEGKSMKDTFNAMYQEYNRIIDYYDEELHDFWIANLFRKNRDGLILFGDESLTLEGIKN